MKVLILSGSPKTHGLAHDSVQAALKGAQAAGADVQVISLCSSGIARCHVCGEGWGTCREDRRCAFGDDGFDAAQQAIRDADAVIFATPVYYGEVSEPVKALIDRLRRCEGLRGRENHFQDKPVLLIATPGGSGGGGLTCLDQLARACGAMGMPIFDQIIINRWTRDYQLETVARAARALGEGKRPG